MSEPKSKTLKEESLLTMEELAEWLKVPRDWVRDHSNGHRGVQIPSIKIGRYRRYRKSEVEAWLDQARRQTACVA